MRNSPRDAGPPPRSEGLQPPLVDDHPGLGGVGQAEQAAAREPAPGSRHQGVTLIGSAPSRLRKRNSGQDFGATEAGALTAGNSAPAKSGDPIRPAVGNGPSAAFPRLKELWRCLRRSPRPRSQASNAQPAPDRNADAASEVVAGLMGLDQLSCRRALCSAEGCPCRPVNVTKLRAYPDNPAQR